MEVVAVQMMVLLRCLQFIACWCNNGGSGGLDDGALASSAVCRLLTQ
jgi:hypothetical protein